MLMDRAELLDKMENTIKEINQTKEQMAKTSNPAAADRLRTELHRLLNSHFDLVDQLG